MRGLAVYDSFSVFYPLFADSTNNFTSQIILHIPNDNKNNM